jgi:hypothetical protein
MEGGATPNIVPFITGLPGPGPPGAAAPGAPAGAAGSGCAPGRGTPAGAFIMSIVPLNFGAAAPFSLKPHLVQVVELSGFCVPQLGQKATLKSSVPARAFEQDPQPTTPLVTISSGSGPDARGPFRPSPAGAAGGAGRSPCRAVDDHGFFIVPEPDRGLLASALDTPVCGSLRFAPPVAPGDAQPPAFCPGERTSPSRITD